MDGSLEFVFNDLDLNFYPELTHDDVTTLSTLHSELNYVQKDYDTGSDVTTEMNDVWTLNFSEWCQTLAESGRREAGGGRADWSRCRRWTAGGGRADWSRCRRLL